MHLHSTVKIFYKQLSFEQKKYVTRLQYKIYNLLLHNTAKEFTINIPIDLNFQYDKFRVEVINMHNVKRIENNLEYLSQYIFYLKDSVDSYFGDKVGYNFSIDNFAILESFDIFYEKWELFCADWRECVDLRMKIFDIILSTGVEIESIIDLYKISYLEMVEFVAPFIDKKHYIIE